jgi:hypothetical protein
MKEHQNPEWKESWRDEYLKWICAFANAEGGLLVIGRNDAAAPNPDCTMSRTSFYWNSYLRRTTCVG